MGHYRGFAAPSSHPSPEVRYGSCVHEPYLTLLATSHAADTPRRGEREATALPELAGTVARASPSPPRGEGARRAGEGAGERLLRASSVTEPSSAGEPSKIVTITYDAAERVGTISQPDSTTEEFSPAQTQGWTNSGTSGSPAPATLLAAAGSTLHRPQRQRTTIRPDWWGLGPAGQSTDALGNTETL